MGTRPARRVRRRGALTSLLLVLACGDDSSSDDAGLSGGASTGEDVVDTTGDAVDTTGDDDDDDDDDDTGPPAPKYDVLGIPDQPPPPAVECNGEPGGGRGARVDSFIWIANNNESTVSKVDTVTLQEVGRYLTHPDQAGDPSRTSVNLNGDVAVANRMGGLVTFFGRQADCIDRNGDGQIQTSSGPADVLAWEDEECRNWYAPFDYTTQRPVAWTAGEWNPETCRYEDAHVWSSGATNLFGGGGGRGEVELDDIRIIRVDGDTGETEALIKVPEVDPGFFGMYGGAVDADGNFYASQNHNAGSLVRVSLEDDSYDVWPMPVHGYGITVDENGYVWTCSIEVARFDPEIEEWETAGVGGSGGCMSDGEGTLWLGQDPMIGVDTETLEVVAQIELPEYVHGISIDFYGYVWGVGMEQSAYRVDPATGEFEIVDTLSSPYTYSDMTGFALAAAGGFTPAG